MDGVFRGSRGASCNVHVVYDYLKHFQIKSEHLLTNGFNILFRNRLMMCIARDWCGLNIFTVKYQESPDRVNRNDSNQLCLNTLACVMT